MKLWLHMIMYHYIHTHINFHWKEHGHASQRQISFRSNYALLVSTMLLRRKYYVNAVPTIVALCQSGSYYVVTMSLPRPLTATLVLRKFWTCSKFDHVLAVLAHLTTLLPRLCRFYHAHQTPTSFSPLRERIKDIVETWPGVSGVIWIGRHR